MQDANTEETTIKAYRAQSSLLIPTLLTAGFFPLMSNLVDSKIDGTPSQNKQVSKRFGCYTKKYITRTKAERLRKIAEKSRRRNRRK